MPRKELMHEWYSTDYTETSVEDTNWHALSDVVMRKWNSYSALFFLNIFSRAGEMLSGSEPHTALIEDWIHIWWQQLPITQGAGDPELVATV